MPNDTLSDLFREDGFLDRSRLTEDATSVLDDCVEWLLNVGRSVFLPIDLLGILLRRGHADLERVVGQSGAISADGGSVVEQLQALAKRVERENTNPVRLHLDQFSLGFTGILTDALAWAREGGRERVCEADLVRVMRWRAELQESASIRWALRQLAQPGGEFIFEPEGQLRRGSFTSDVWLTLMEGMRLSSASGLAFLGTPHFMAAVVKTRGLLGNACEQVGVKPRRLQNDLLAIVGDRSPPQPEFPLSRQTLTPRLVRMLIAAARVAEARSARVGEPAILESFLGDGGSSLELVTALGLIPVIRRAIEREGPSKREGRVSVLGGALALGDGDGDETPTLDQLGRDLTALAKSGDIPKVLGRDEELQRVINVLMRTEQRNPLLTGQAGVGKTAIANALAQRIADGTVPERLVNMRVIEINGASLVGGTSYRGELEARIRSLLEECEDDVILFIDEAHAVFAPRSSSGQPAEIPNHFKSALASGKIAVVAATTESEFRQWMEDDPALRRRFERIHIEELSDDVTRHILGQLAPKFEEDYKVPVTPDAVDAAIELSQRFMPEQSLPDKAKKLLMDATISVASEIALAKARGTNQAMGHDTPSKRVVTRLDVAKQVSQKTGAPLERVVRGTISWWVGLEERLARHIVGQEGAVKSVAKALVSGRLTNAGRKRPQSVFLFVGQPGVGKNDLARAMSEEIFGSADDLLRLEMSDFAEAHSISRLIGSPPGYVGYRDEDALVTPLRRKPSRVVMLQDFPKAHPRVQDRLVRLFAEGEIADTRGMSADASHAIFVLTIEEKPKSGGSIGFGKAGSAAQDVLRKVAPDLADRFAGLGLSVVVFDGLRDGDGELAEKLLRFRMAQFRESLLEEYDIELVIPAHIDDLLVERVRELDDARGIEGVFREIIVEPVTVRLLEGPIGQTLTIGDTVSEDVDREPEPA
ncbi:MAG: ATP-dependent Clp protease ATP-binding subunit ClpC [Bradymonadia bacterium]|jgi:ATP-dependent Clp protease ATP-binding subunit ClpC